MANFPFRSVERREQLRKQAARREQNSRKLGVHNFFSKKRVEISQFATCILNQ